LDDPNGFLRETGRKDFYDEPAICVCDYISGMTDRYAFMLFERLFLPMPWKITV
jgi:dGTP triphosphohydrolase